MAATTHLISRRPPLRALALGASVTVVGLLGVFAAVLASGPWPVVALGWLAVALGLALGVGGWLAARSAHVRVELDDAGYEVISSAGDTRGKWADVVRVSMVGNRIQLHQADGTVTALIAPASSKADLEALAADIASHLDANRGYGQA